MKIVTSIIATFCILISCCVVQKAFAGKNITPIIVTEFGVKVYENQKGLRNNVEIIGPMKGFYSVSKDINQTIQGLIEDVSIYLPFNYSSFGVEVGCIIVLGKDFNDKGFARVRILPALECKGKQFI